MQGFVVLEEMTNAELTLSWDFGTMNNDNNLSTEQGSNDSVSQLKQDEERT